MVEIDPYFFYWVAAQTHYAIMGLMHAESYPVRLAKDGLERFVNSYKEDFLPKSKAKAKSVITMLEHYLHAMSNKHSTITAEDLAKVNAEIVEFEDQLKEESKHLYALCVEDQRLFSAYVLVERIEKSLSTKTWKYMSVIARREIEESGRCLAFERYTSSGFHMLRCVETIIKDYIAACGVSLSPSDRNWGRYGQILKENGAADDVVSIVESMRRDDRNTLMHPEKFLNQDDAIGLFNLSQTALDRLINDMEKRRLAKEFVS